MPSMSAWWTRLPPLPQPPEALVDRLWLQLAAEQPAAARFAHLARSFALDHLAFGTVARPGSGLALFAGVFERRGWRAEEAREVGAGLRTLVLTRPGHASVLVEEQDPAALPSAARAALLRLPADAPAPADDAALAAWFKAPLPPSGADLDLLAPLSPLGAWLLALGRRPMRLAASAADLEGWQRRLQQAGVVLAGPIESCAVEGGALEEGANEGNEALRRLVLRPVELPLLLRDGSRCPWPGPSFELVERPEGQESFRLPSSSSAALGKPGIRRHPRTQAVLHVEIGYGALRVPVLTGNVSLGGLFLQLADEDAPAAHSVLQLKIELPTGPIEALATVVFHQPGRGVGVEFQWWDDDQSVERRALADFLAELTPKN